MWPWRITPRFERAAATTIECEPIVVDVMYTNRANCRLGAAMPQPASPMNFAPAGSRAAARTGPQPSVPLLATLMTPGPRILCADSSGFLSECCTPAEILALQEGNADLIKDYTRIGRPADAAGAAHPCCTRTS